MTAIRPAILAVVDMAQALVSHAPSNRPLTIDEACQIADCVQDVQATLQPDESQQNTPLTLLDMQVVNITPLRTTFIDLPENNAFIDATKELLGSPTSITTPLTDEERQRLRVCTESLMRLVSSDMTNTSHLRGPALAIANGR